MIFLMHLSLILAYGVVLASTSLFIWSLRNKGEGSTLGKAVGAVLFILSVLSILCASYYGIKYWRQGSFESPMEISTMMHQKDIMQVRQKLLKKIQELQKKRIQGLQEKAKNKGNAPQG